MKKFLVLLVILFTCGLGIYAQKPLTQYYLVGTSDLGAGFRGSDEISRFLKKLGFSVTTYTRPDDVDEMESFTILKASRKVSDGTTNVFIGNGEDIYCVIDFANQAEVDAFVESLKAAHYHQDGTFFAHPANDISKIYVRVNGLNVKLIWPFEMLPNDF